MNVYCAGIYDDDLHIITVGIFIVLPNGREIPLHHKINTGKSLDNKTGTKAAQYEAVIMGLREAQKLYMKYLSQQPFSRMHFVELGGGSRVLDFRGLTGITLIADSIVKIPTNYTPTTKFYNNWYNHFCQIEGFFRGYDVQITISRGDIHEAKKIAEENRPDSKYYKYKNNMKNLIQEGEYVVPISIFKKQTNITISEALVLELIDNAGLSISKVAKELGRDYNTIYTQYHRAKIKMQAKLDKPVTNEIE